MRGQLYYGTVSHQDRSQPAIGDLELLRAKNNLVTGILFDLTPF